MKNVLLGAIAMASFVAGLYFIRFWKKTGDRFFLFFAVAFWIDAVGRVIFALVELPENFPFAYLMRLSSYGLILFAIADKNWPITRRRP